MKWDGKLKAVTFSYDDGVEQDIRLIDIFNRYGMKCTFNLNSELAAPESSWVNGGVTIRRIGAERYPSIYNGHEPAVHTLTHPHLENLDEAEIDRQIRGDKENLERIFNTNVVGMAYPFGTYDDRVIRIAESIGIRYSRTVAAARGFDAPEDLLRLPSTCHHKEPSLPQLIDQFLAAKPDKPMLFYIWGHSYEFDVNDNWQVIEDICKALAGHADVFYGTNAETLL